ncbi:hypothetical protein JYT20_00745 [Rhodothermus sp. AH-315-K08]|nr:hypothetical protein [Rhodothermus sp. AH-315-K08]
MIKVLLAPSSFAAIDDVPLRKLASAGYELISNPYGRRLTEPEVLDLLQPGTLGIIAGLEPLTRRVMEESELRVISRVGSGISNVDLEAAEELGVKVFSTPTGPTRAVAELTVGCLLSLLRSVPHMDQALHQGTWTKVIGSQLHGKVVAVVGLGRIGRLVASMLDALGAEVIGVDPLLPAEEVELELVSLDEALGRADVLALHASGDSCILDERAFGAMRNGMWLLNASRGEVVDEDALVQALHNGTVRGAWLDTFCTEPYTGPLSEFENVILTPHVGSYTEEARRSMEAEAVDNLITGLRRDGVGDIGLRR